MKRAYLKYSLAAILILGVTAVACREPNPTQLRTESLTQLDATIQAEAGQNFEIVLPSLGSKPTYKWALQSGYNTALLTFDSEREATAEFPDPKPQGYAPNRVFSFKALAVGATELVFRQQALTGGEALPTERRYPINIQGALNPVVSATPSP
jgi:hypothetical protein